jgi:hypothetical protein
LSCGIELRERSESGIGPRVSIGQKNAGQVHARGADIGGTQEDAAKIVI